MVLQLFSCGLVARGRVGPIGEDHETRPPTCVFRADHHQCARSHVLARTRHPGAKHTLDALCSRFGIDRSHRVLHGALLDAQLLAQVYVELMGGRQIGLTLVNDLVVEQVVTVGAAPRIVRPPRHFAAREGELAAHAAFMKGISQPIWGAPHV